VNYKGFQAPQEQESICVPLDTVYTRHKSIKGLKEAALSNFFHSASPQLILLSSPLVPGAPLKTGHCPFWVLSSSTLVSINSLTRMNQSV